MKRRKMPKGTKPIVFILLVLYVVISIKISNLYTVNQSLETKEQQLQSLIDLELERQRELEQQERYLQSMDYIEYIARERLGLIRPNETLLLPKDKE